jgi:phosphate transport system substrate-binding protein
MLLSGGNHVNRALRVLFCIFTLSAGVMAQTTLNGAGASFPNPIYQKWFSEYHNLHPDVQVNYQSVGSGAGIRQVQAGTVDFGASDGPMTDEQIASSKVKVLHVPTVLGAVVPAYNIPGVSQEVKFTGEILAGIFLGKITNWSDGTIAKANPDIKFPNQNITVVHRSDGSGTSYIFTDYLSKISSDWANTTGKGTSVKWPVGVGGKGNEGVAGTIRTLPGAVGYIELIYALQNKINYGSVKNASGQFIKASLESTTAAASGVKMPADFRVSITNPPGKTAYPIASFTWLLIPTNPADKNKGKLLKDLVLWCLDSGEAMVSALSYAPLPKEVADKAKDAVKQQVK